MMETKQSETKKALKAFASEHKTELIIVTSVLGTAALGHFGHKYIPQLIQTYTNITAQSSASKSLVATMNTIKETMKPIIKKKVPRYRVEFKAFKTGNWYTKTITDYINSAYSVAYCNSFGRAYRIIDTETGRVMKEALEDASMAACNGYPR